MKYGSNGSHLKVHVWPNWPTGFYGLFMSLFISQNIINHQSSIQNFRTIFIGEAYCIWNLWNRLSIIFYQRKFMAILAHLNTGFNIYSYWNKLIKKKFKWGKKEQIKCKWLLYCSKASTKLSDFIRVQWIHYIIYISTYVIMH